MCWFILLGMYEAWACGDGDADGMQVRRMLGVIRCVGWMFVRWDGVCLGENGRSGREK